MNKKIYMLGIPFLALALVSAAIYFATIPVTFSVGEALSTTTITGLNFNGTVGSCVIRTIDVNNAANNPLPVSLVWVETLNNGVTYTIDIPREEILQPGNNLINISLCYNNNSYTGSVSGNIILSRGSGNITTVAHFTQKDISTWESKGISADVTYTMIGETFTVTGIPEGYTLVYYPDTVGGFDTNIENILVLTEGSNNIPSLPIAIDVGDDYCNIGVTPENLDGYNPNAKVCDGAKLWLLPGNLNLADAKAYITNWNTNAPNILFETDLITYTQTD